MPASSQPDAVAIRAATLAGLPYQPLDGQSKLIDALANFTAAPPSRAVFVINGYAGTGKTSVMGAYVRALKRAGVKTVLLAPTGRAAKVFSDFAGAPASTIHRRLFRPASEPGQRKYVLAPNRLRDTVFIVDEASMISDRKGTQKSLLWLLLHYVYSGPGCRMIMVGDMAQLPPVGQEVATAMTSARLRSLGLMPEMHLLSEPARQARDSGILFNATNVRRMITGELDAMRLVTLPFSDVSVVDGYDLEDSYTDSLRRTGVRDTIIITRSNWRANDYNNYVRTRIFDEEELLSTRDMVMIAKNNYYWTRHERPGSFLANGDIAMVRAIGRLEEAYGMQFVDVELEIPGREDLVAAKVNLTSLASPSPSLDPNMERALYYRLMAEAEGEFSEKITAVENNPYYQALQVKHSYCITCHKAQGGQWRHVYIDMAGIDPAAMGEEFYRWLYTAITRAREKVFFISPTLPTDLPD